MKKQTTFTITILQIALVGFIGVALLGCNSSKEESNVIKIGINGGKDIVWDSVSSLLEKEGYTLELVSFSDYILPNLALSDREIDANAFQTVGYFEEYLQQSGSDLSIASYTQLAPMGIYPGLASSIAEIPENGKIAIPQGLSNGGRALRLLESAGLITVDPSKGILPDLADITANPLNLEIIRLTPALIPTALDELDAGVINNGIAIDAKLIPFKSSIFMEDPADERMVNYYNIIAVQTEDLDSPKINALVKAYQDPQTRKAIEVRSDGTTIIVF